MGLFFYNSNTGVGIADAFRDGKLREHRSSGEFHNYGSGWTDVASTADNLFFYNAGKGTARVATIVRIGKFDVLPSKTTLSGFSPGWTSITQVTQDAMLFYNRTTGHTVIGRLANGAFATITPVMQLKYGWTHVEPLFSNLVFYDSQQGLAALTPFVDSNVIQQGLGDVFEFAGGYTAVVAVGGLALPLTTSGEQWLLAYNKNTGDGAVYAFQNDALVKTQDYTGAFSKGWDIIVQSEGYLFFYRSDGTGAVGRINQGKFVTDTSYSNLSSGWTHIATPGGRWVDLGGGGVLP